MKITIIFLSVFFLISCSKQEKVKNEGADKNFSFVFMTDIHLQPEHRYSDLSQQPELSPRKAFSMVIDTVNQLGADFVLMGGDQIYDVLRGQSRSDSLFQMFNLAIKDFTMPVYKAIGNHELYGIYEESSISSNHPDYKYGMYERYFGDTYYSFDHKGWHFIVLNSIDERDKRYIGIIDKEQKSWLKDDLSKVDPETPVVVALHLPLISIHRQIYPRPESKVPNERWVFNSNEILDMFYNHNLKVVLQGHLHWVEDIYLYESDTRFISGGAVAGRPSWRGFRNGPPGFLVINIKNMDISWDFIDYGWKEHIMSYENTELVTSISK